MLMPMLTWRHVARQAAIDIKVELKSGTDDDVYLNRLRAALERAALVLPRPDLVRALRCVGVGQQTSAVHVRCVRERACWGVVG